MCLGERSLTTLKGLLCDTLLARSIGGDEFPNILPVGGPTTVWDGTNKKPTVVRDSRVFIICTYGSFLRDALHILARLFLGVTNLWSVLFQKIACVGAMINAAGNERQNEWVTIANFSESEIDLSGWTLSDTRRPPLVLSGRLLPGETTRVQPLIAGHNQGVVLYNLGGQLVLCDSSGKQYDRVVYSKKTHTIRENLPVMFHLED